MKRIFLSIIPLIVFAFNINACKGRISTLPSNNPSISPSEVPVPLPSVTDNPNSPTPVSGNYVDLNILSYNVWGLPNPLTKNLKERMIKLGTALNGYDIVNLQETFSDYTDEFILKKLNYTTKIRWNNSTFLSLGSGLSSMSKFPLKKKNFKKFIECATFDCNANKGILFTRVTVPNLGDVDIYNTHYQAEDKYEDIRISANKTLQEFIKENEVGNLTIITGDFNYPLLDNTDSTSKAYKDLKNRLNVIDTYRVANPNDPGFSHDGRNNEYAGEDPPERLDFIFVLPENRLKDKRSNYKVEILSSKIVFNTPYQGMFLSDHFGINTKLRVFTLN
jgi:exonuclease III